jgi:hypothetical protein
MTARKSTSPRSRLPKPKWGGRTAVVFIGGPKDRFWYFTDEAEGIARRCAEAGERFEYEPTKEFQPNPDFDAVGAVWKFNPALAAQRAHRLRDVTAEQFAESRRVLMSMGTQILTRLARNCERFTRDQLSEAFDAGGVLESVRGVVTDNAIDDDVIEVDQDDTDFFLSLTYLSPVERASA